MEQLLKKKFQIHLLEFLLEKTKTNKFGKELSAKTKMALIESGEKLDLYSYSSMS